MQAMEHNPQRKHQRHAVAWDARLDLGSSLVVGKVRDWSQGGICFEPEAGYLDGAFQSGEQLLHELGRGDLARVIIKRGYGTKEVATAGVRWCGYSEKHGCIAIGLEFLS